MRACDLERDEIRDGGCWALGLSALGLCCVSLCGAAPVASGARERPSPLHLLCVRAATLRAASGWQNESMNLVRMPTARPTRSSPPYQALYAFEPGAASCGAIPGATIPPTECCVIVGVALPPPKQVANLAAIAGSVFFR